MSSLNSLLLALFASGLSSAPGTDAAAESMCRSATPLLERSPAGSDHHIDLPKKASAAAAEVESFHRFIAQEPVGNLIYAESVLDCLGSDERALARAWIALRRNDASEAERALLGAVLPRHHMQPRWSVAHDTLGDAYARQGQTALAQGQWLIALATAFDPGRTGFSPEATRRKVAKSIEELGLQRFVPLNRYHDAVSILDAKSVQRTEVGRRYSKLVLLKNKESGADYGIDSYEIDCGQARSRVTQVQFFNAKGDLVRETGGTAWLGDRPGEPFLGTERKVVCDLDLTTGLAEASQSPVEMLKAYRDGRPFANPAGKPVSITRQTP